MVLEELLLKIKTVENLGGLDKLSSKLRSTESLTKSASGNMKNNLNQINNVRFESLSNRFKGAISTMVTTASSGAKTISNDLQSMVSSTEGALAGITGAVGTGMLFEHGMEKALTQTQLKNVKPGEYKSIMDQYMSFTEKSSASDTDINKMLRFTYMGDASQTYKALNAVDAVSYSADKLQRQEGIRGWGTYLTGGWTAASGMMRDEPLTADQKKLLQGATTYDERVAAMETIAKQKGTVDKFGNSLSTTTDGPLGKYNKSLAVQDAIIRGATTSFDNLMATLEPLITWFAGLDQGTKDVIGTFLTIGAVGLTLATGLGALLLVLSPVTSGLGKLFSKLPVDLPSWLTSTKDKTINAVNVRVNGKTVTGGGTTTTPTGGNKGGILPMITSALAYGTGGLAIGDAVSNYGIGPFFDQVNKIMPGGGIGAPFKSYHGILDFLGMGNSNYSVLNYNDRISANMKSYGAKTPKDSGIKWPTQPQIMEYIKKNIPKIGKLVWPSGGAIYDFITKIFPAIPKLQWPTAGSISSWIQSAINRSAGAAIKGGGAGATATAAGGDAQSMLEAGLSGGNTYLFYIGNVDSQETADYFINQVTTGLGKINDEKGRN